MSEQSKRERLGQLADEIEAEMRRLNVWDPNPPSEETVLAGGAFGLKTVAFEQWIQVVFVTRLRQVASGEMTIPSSSSVAVQGVREFDGRWEFDHLQKLLSEVDGIVN